MKVMVMVKADPASEAGEMPDTELLARMGEYNAELAKAGILLAGEGLKPSSRGVRVRFEAGLRTRIDGPFADPRELVAGFWLWQVRNLDEAVEWLTRAPFDGGAEVEIRPLFEAEDFDGAFTADLRDQARQLPDGIAVRH